MQQQVTNAPGANDTNVCVLWIDFFQCSNLEGWQCVLRITSLGNYAKIKYWIL